MRQTERILWRELGKQEFDWRSTANKNNKTQSAVKKIK